MPELIRVVNEYKSVIHQNLAVAVYGLEKELTAFLMIQNTFSADSSVA